MGFFELSIIYRVNQKFPKNEKLKSSKTISELFLEGKVHTQFPIRMLYKANSEETNRIAFSVPKRRFKHAVDRNRIKRQLREVYRLNKNLLVNDSGISQDIMFIYLGNKLPEYALLEKKMIKLLASLAEDYQG